jgi:hypothetical protein
MLNGILLNSLQKYVKYRNTLKLLSINFHNLEIKPARLYRQVLLGYMSSQSVFYNH